MEAYTRAERGKVSARSYEIFRGKLYVGAGTYSSGIVLEYDGSEAREALSGIPKLTVGGPSTIVNPLLGEEF